MNVLKLKMQSFAAPKLRLRGGRDQGVQPRASPRRISTRDFEGPMDIRSVERNDRLRTFQTHPNPTSLEQIEIDISELGLEPQFRSQIIGQPSNHG